MRRACLLLVAALVACGAPSPNSAAPRSEAHQVLPALTFPLIEGGTWSSQDARGRVLVIDVWASWCQPCKKGLPKVDALASRPDVSVVAVSIDEEVSAIRTFLAGLPLTMPVAQDRGQVLTGAPIRVQHLPTVLVVDRAGLIRHRLDEPAADEYDRLPALIDALRAEP